MGFKRFLIKNNRIDVNGFWVILIMIHLLASVLAVFSRLIPHFPLFCGIGIWLASCGIFYRCRKSIRPILIGAVGIPFLGLLFHKIPQAYEQSFLLSEMILAFVFCLARVAGISLKEYCHIRRLRPASCLLGILIGLLAYIIAGYINALAELFFHNFVSNYLMTDLASFFINILIFALIPAFSEELCFRGIIYRGVGSVRKAILVSALLFGLMHMNFDQICYAFLMGILFAVVLTVTDNLLVTMIIHLVFNAFTVCQISFYRLGLFQFINNLNLAGYHFYTPTIHAENGRLSLSLVAWGGISALAALALVLLSAVLIRKLEENAIKTEFSPAEEIELSRDGESEMVPEGETEKETAWKPDAAFFAVCGLCILMAILVEIGMA